MKLSHNDRFYGNHWTEAKPRILARATQIEDSMKDLDVFKAWSEVLGQLHMCHTKLGQELPFQSGGYCVLPGPLVCLYVRSRQGRIRYFPLYRAFRSSV